MSPQWTLVGEATVALAKALGTPVAASLAVGCLHRSLRSAVLGAAAGVAAIAFVNLWAAMLARPSALHEPLALSDPWTFLFGVSLTYAPLLGSCQVFALSLRQGRRDGWLPFRWARNAEGRACRRVLLSVVAVHAGFAAVLLLPFVALVPGALSWVSTLVPLGVGGLAAVPIASQGPETTLVASPWRFAAYASVTSVTSSLLGFLELPTLWRVLESGASARLVIAWVGRLEYAGPTAGAAWVFATLVTLPMARLAAAVTVRVAGRWA